MSDHEESDGEEALDKLHQLLVEVKDYLEDNAVTPKGQKILGKVEFMLDNWDDDAFFVSEDEGEDDDEGLPDLEGGVEEDDEDEEDEYEDEGSILDEPK